MTRLKRFVLSIVMVFLFATSLSAWNGRDVLESCLYCCGVAGFVLIISLPLTSFSILLLNYKHQYMMEEQARLLNTSCRDSIAEAVQLNTEKIYQRIATAVPQEVQEAFFFLREENKRLNNTVERLTQAIRKVPAILGD